MQTFTRQRRERSGPAGGGNSTRATSEHASPQHDGRPASVAQRALQTDFNESPRVQTQLQLGQALNAGPRAVAQAKLAADVTVQRRPAEEEELVAQPQTTKEEETPTTKNKCASVAGCDEAEDEEGAEEMPSPGLVAPVQGKLGDASEAAVGVGTKGGLPAGLSAGIEALSGVSVADVKVEYNSPEPAKIGALATTQGREIKLGRGQEKHLPHEAWHAAQQKQGRVRATTQLRRTPVNDDHSLEREADVMGARAARLPLDGGLAGADAVQRMASGFAGVGVAQLRGDEDEVETDVGAELEKAIDLIRKVADEGTEDGETEQSRELAGYIEQLEEIARGDDEVLKAEMLETLNEESKKQSGLSIEEISEEVSELPAESGEEPLQGYAGALFAYLFGAAQANPYTALTTTLAVVAVALVKVVSVKAESSRKTLPPSANANLFANNKEQYWAYLKRYIQDFCKANDVSDKDKKSLEDSTIDALNAARKDEDIPERYAAAAAKHGWDDANFLRADFFTDNIFRRFELGLGVVIKKQIASANVSSDDLPGFTAALKKLPFVKALYAGQVYGEEGKESGEGKSERPDAPSQWADGGKLTGKVKTVDDGSILTRSRGDIDNGSLVKRVAEADQFIRRIVEPEILSGIPRPTIAVHLRNNKGFTSPFGLRAHTSGNEVHIAQNQTTDIIVHELGHYIEDNLPMEQWAQIQTLLQKRKGTATKAGYVSPVAFNEKLSFDEQRYPGSYPGTGIYTSRYYTGGATEVTSRTAEYLSHPTRFKNLIEKDPQQAALILRLLRPREFAKERSLDQYVDKYLPAAKSRL